VTPGVLAFGSEEASPVLSASRARRSPLRIAAYRQQRSQLYRLLAATHAGPLGYALFDTVRSLAASLLEYAEFLPPYPPPPAAVYHWSYGFCPGSCELGCGPASPAACLPRHFNFLADSTRRGAAKRRLREADYIERELLPCLDTIVKQMEVEAYRQLLVTTRQIVLKDAEQIRARPEVT